MNGIFTDFASVGIRLCRRPCKCLDSFPSFLSELTVDIPWTRCHSGRMVKASPPSLIPVERVASRIYLIRNRKIMLDFDLAELYGVPTKAFNQAVTRNAERFPEDFMFRLSRRGRSHEPVTICDRFPEAPRPQISASRLYPGRRCHALWRASQQA